MFAIVNILGKQYKVEKGQQIYVHRIDAQEGDTVTFDEVLMTVDGDKAEIGTPALGSSVKVKVLDHLKDDKVIVFKKKRRKGYRVKNGHRQYLTKIEIEDILPTGGKKTTALSEKSTPHKTLSLDSSSLLVKDSSKANEVSSKTAKPKAATKKADVTSKSESKTASKKAESTSSKSEAKSTSDVKADSSAKEKEAKTTAKKSDSTAAKEAAPKAAATAKKTTAKKADKGDDLTKIEGIGPKIKGLLHDAGIVTFADLADAKEDTLKDILAAAGSRYSMHNPATWPQQSKLAADGKWDELKELQDKLDGGRA